MTDVNKLVAGALVSSKDATKLSLTVRGLLLQLVPVVMLVAQAKGIGVVETDLVAIIEGVTAIVAMVISAVGLIMTVWGLVRKLFDPVNFEIYVPERLEK